MLIRWNFVCVCVGGHGGFDVYGGSYACGGVENRSVFGRLWVESVIIAQY